MPYSMVCSAVWTNFQETCAKNSRREDEEEVHTAFAIEEEEEREGVREPGIVRLGDLSLPRRDTMR